MKHLRAKISLCVLWILGCCTGFSHSQQLSDYAGNGQMKGVFKGIVAGKQRVKGAKQPFSGWVLEDERGETSVFAVLESDASVRKVAASPKAYIGKKCVVVWDTVEELLTGQREPTDLTRIRAVRWEAASLAAQESKPAGAGAAVKPSDSGDVAMESVVRSFFEAVQGKDLAGVSSLLDDPVQYYQNRPMPRSAALSDIKADWKRYSDWHGVVADFQAKDTLSCAFRLNYTAMEGEKPRAGELLCEVTLNPNPPHRIKSISAKPVKKTGAVAGQGGDSGQGGAGVRGVRTFRFKRVGTDDETGALFDIDISITPETVSGVWKSAPLTNDTDFERERIEFSGKILGADKGGTKKVLMSFKGGREPYLFPANQKPYWLLREGAAGTTIQVTAYRVFGRNSEKVVWEFREVLGN